MQRRPSPVLHAPLASALVLLAFAPALAAQENCPTRRISTSELGAQASGHSRYPALSADGRYVAFESTAADLVPGDGNGASDVFLKFLPTGALTPVSRGLGGGPAAGASDHASVSADGEWVVFESEAGDLVPGDTNGLRDVFLFQRSTGAITRISVSNAGVQGNGPSGQGGLLRGSGISANGEHIVFQSSASNLVPGDTNLASDIFLYERPSSSLVRLTVHPQGPQANGVSQDPAISADGTRVAFLTWSTNLVAPDTNNAGDILVVELGTGSFQRASHDSGGIQADSESYRPALSADGLVVAFESFATNLVPGDSNGTVDVFVHELASGLTERVSIGWLGQQANGYAYRASLSADGQRVGFTSAASNLTPGGNGIQGVYVRDRALGTTERWGQDSAGNNGFGGSDDASLSAAGDSVAFTSIALLVPQDSNGALDVYLRSCGPTGSAFCFGHPTSCPCANALPGPGGCTNSLGNAGVFTASGTASVLADSVTLRAEGLPPAAPILFFQGNNVLGGGLGVAFGDGLRCVSGQILRLGTRQANGAGVAQLGDAVGGDPAISVQGFVPAGGALRMYQGWYRDTAPFCTAQGFNLTDAYAIDWAP